MIRTDTAIYHATPKTRAARPVAKIFRLLVNVRTERAALAHLTADQLADIGLDPSDQSRESTRAPWDVPTHWLATGKRR